MDIRISTGDGVPVYVQIIHQVKNLIASGHLQVDQEIPPIRKLAECLLINPNTVARAYRELETEGWIYKRRGAGSFVSDRASPLSKVEQLRRLDERIAGLLTDAYQMDLPLPDLIARICRLHQERNKDD